MPKAMKSLYKVVHGTFHAFRQHDGLTLAAALSFYATLSLIPLSMISVSILGHFLGQSDEALGRIMEFITEVIPTFSPQFIQELTAIINRKLTSGWIGIAFLILVASILFTGLEKALDKVFGSVRRRNFFHSRLLSIAFLFLISLLWFVPGVFKAVDTALSYHQIPISLAPLIHGDLFFFWVSVLSFVLVLEVVPNHEVKIRYNLIGGVLFAGLLMSAKYLFRWYTAFSLARLNLVYGALTSLVLIILWIFYLITLLLLCAELVAILQKHVSEKTS